MNFGIDLQALRWLLIQIFMLLIGNHLVFYAQNIYSTLIIYMIINVISLIITCLFIIKVHESPHYLI